DVAFIVDRRRARTRRDADAELSGHGERAQIFHVIRQIAQTLAEEQRRREGRKGLGADALRPAAADIPIDAGGEDRLVLVVLIKLVLDACREIVESALRVAAIRLPVM